MAVTLNASTTAGLVQTADTSGVLALQSNGTTALTTSGANVTVAGTLTTAAQSIAKASLPTGSVLQVVSVNKTDTFSSATTGAFTDITTFSIAITPTSSSSKILVLYSVEMGASHTSDLVILRLMRDSTAINIGALVGSRSQGTTANQTLYSNLNNTSRTIAGNFLDSPATTSSTTYKIQFRNNSGTFYINRDGENTDNASHSQGASNITVMEIAA